MKNVGEFNGSVLVIGWGNDLLGDDAAGRRVAQEIAARRWPGVEALEMHQLTPELALRLTEAECVIFVDAYPASEEDGVLLRRLAGADSTDTPGVGHMGRPEDLLRMAATLYGTKPEAWMIGIPACSFEPGDALSGRTRSGIQQALRAIENLVRGNIHVPR